MSSYAKSCAQKFDIPIFTIQSVENNPWFNRDEFNKTKGKIKYHSTARKLKLKKDSEGNFSKKFREPIIYQESKKNYSNFILPKKLRNLFMGVCLYFSTN